DHADAHAVGIALVLVGEQVVLHVQVQQWRVLAELLAQVALLARPGQRRQGGGKQQCSREGKEPGVHGGPWVGTAGDATSTGPYAGWPGAWCNRRPALPGAAHGPAHPCPRPVAVAGPA